MAGRPQAPRKAEACDCRWCGALLYLFRTKVITVGPLDGLVTALLLVGVVVFVIVLIFDGLAWLGQPLAEKRRLSLLARRRRAIRKEKRRRTRGTPCRRPRAA